MNKAIEIGRLTRDPEVRYSQGNNTAVASYTNKDGQKIYTTEITVEEQEFAESKGSSEAQGTGQMPTPNGDGFMSVPDDDTGLPFN